METAIHTASTQYRCVESHIQVVSHDDAVHTAVLDVCGTPRAYRLTPARGRREWIAVADTATSGSDEVADRVHREPTSNGTDFRLRAETIIEGTSVRWLAIPARDADHVAVTFVTERALPTSDCAVRAMVDGQVVDLPRSGEPTGDLADRTAFVSAPLAFVRSVASSQRAAIRVCSVELQLGTEERAVLTELITRIEEEERWSAPAAP